MMLVLISKAKTPTFIEALSCLQYFLYLPDFVDNDSTIYLEDLKNMDF